MAVDLKKWIGQEIVVGQQRAGGNVFYMRGELLDITATHLFIFSGGKTQGLLLAELAKIELSGGRV